MQKNQEVSYVDAKGDRHIATITEIVGKGPSHYKTLDLSYRQDGKDRQAAAVPHENDAEPGEPFWLEKGAPRREPAVTVEAERPQAGKLEDGRPARKVTKQ